MKFVRWRGDRARGELPYFRMEGAVADSRGEHILDEDGGDSLAEASAVPQPLPNLGKASEQISELLIQARDSIVMVEDSELQVIARISAEFNRPSESGMGRDSAEALRDSEVDRLTAEVHEEAAEASKSEAEKVKKDISERVVVLPRTHLLANSIAPTAAIKSVAPAAAPRGPFWQIVAAAAALVGLGVGLGQLQPHQARTDASPAVETGVAPSRAAAAMQREPIEEPAVVRQEPALVPNSLAVAHAAAAEKQGEEPLAEVAAEVPVAVQAVTPEKAKSPAPARESRAVRSKRGSTKPGQLPAQPSREQVVATMKAAMPALERCAAGRRGSVSAQLTVRGSGQVSYALVQGSFAGTREGSCLAKALRDVRFPAFSETSLRLTYPLQF